jgi:hypothetical protein
MKENNIFFFLQPIVVVVFATTSGSLCFGASEGAGVVCLRADSVTYVNI